MEVRSQAELGNEEPRQQHQRLFNAQPQAAARVEPESFSFREALLRHDTLIACTIYCFCLVVRLNRTSRENTNRVAASGSITLRVDVN